jgi:hypothetical protein
MLVKLIGYETKAFGRIMLPLYAAMLGFALITGLSLRFMPENFTSGLPGVLLFMLYGILMMSIVVMTCVLSVTRFYKNLLGVEGYLMFSLPTGTGTLIASKVISVILWSVDTRDWAARDADTVLSAMGRSVGDGDIVLMHDMSDSSVRAALHLVDDLRRLVPVATVALHDLRDAIQRGNHAVLSSFLISSSTGTPSAPAMRSALSREGLTLPASYFAMVTRWILDAIASCA